MSLSRSAKRSVVAVIAGANIILVIVGLAGVRGDLQTWLGWVPYVYPLGGWLSLILTIYWLFWIGGDEVAEARESRDTQRIAALEAEKAELQGALKSQQVTSSTVFLMSVLLDRGNQILIERITEADYPAWVDKMKGWRRLTLHFIQSQVSFPAAVAFNTTHFTDKKAFKHRVSDEHNTDLLTLEARLQKLSE